MGTEYVRAPAEARISDAGGDVAWPQSDRMTGRSGPSEAVRIVAARAAEAAGFGRRRGGFVGAGLGKSRVATVALRQHRRRLSQGMASMTSGAGGRARLRTRQNQLTVFAGLIKRLLRGMAGAAHSRLLGRTGDAVRRAIPVGVQVVGALAMAGVAIQALL